MLRIVMALASLALAMIATQASAESWRRAETSRFIVYSDGDATILADSARQLELYDSVLRFLHGVDPEARPNGKLSIYLVKDTAALRQVRPGAPEMMRGFYVATDDDIFAIAIRERRSMRTLLHEYAHHFMMENFATGYPSWLVEGYAEYFSTADLDTRQITVGLHDENRASWLQNGDWLPLQDLLSKRPGEFRTSNEVAQFYAQSWLTTHWFLSSTERTPWLVAYITNIRSGMGSIEAMEHATGMTLPVIERSLRTHARSRVAIKQFSADLFPRPDITVTPVSEGASALLLLNLRLNRDQGDDGAAILSSVRARAASYPDDGFVQNVLARAEIELGDPAAAEAILTRRLAKVPDDVQAQYLMGRLYLERADDADDALPVLRQARNYLGRAYELDPNRYQTLMALAQVRSVAPNFPNDNDMDVLLAAYDLAPQVATIRIFAAQAHMERQETAQGIALLEPLAQSPHDDGAARLAQAMIARAQATEIESPEEETAASPGNE